MPTTGHTAQTEQRILNDSKDSLYDTLAVTPFLETTVGAVSQRATATDVGGKIAQDVNIVGGSLTGSDGAILDGANSAIKATVKDLTNSNPLTVAITDGNGDQITSFGGGVQYTEGATDASITGTAAMWEDAADTLVAASAAKPFPVEIIAGAGSGGTALADDDAFTPAVTQFTPVGGQTTVDAVNAGDGGAFLMDVDRHQQIDIQDISKGTQTNDVKVTLDSEVATVQATNLDIRDLTATDIVTPVNGVISTNNSSTATLGIGAVFTGTADDVTNYSQSIIQVYSDVASAASGLSIQQSPDGTNWDNIHTHTVSAATGLEIHHPIHAKYFRIVYTNGGTGQASFRLQTSFKVNPALGEIQPVGIQIDSSDQALTTHGVITGVTTAGGGAYVDVKVNPSGALTVEATQGGTWNITDISGTVSLPTGAATAANQTTIIGHVDGIETVLGTIDTDTGNIDTKLGTIDTDTGNIATAVTDIPNVIGTDGAAGPSKAISIAGTQATGELEEIRTDADGHPQIDVLSMPTTTVQATDLDIRNLTNVDVVTAELSAVDNAVLDAIAAKDFATQTTLAAINAKMVTGTDIGDVTINNASGASAVNIQDGGNTITVDGTVTANLSATDNAVLDNIDADTSAIQTAVQLIDDAIIADDATFTPATTKVMMAGFEADETSTDSVDEGDGGAARMTLDRKVIVNPQPHTAGGCDTFYSLDIDESEEAVKASAGQLYGWKITNRSTSMRYVKFYNATTATVQVGTTTPKFTIAIPGGASDNWPTTANGIAFDTAITVACTTGFADNDTGAPSANDVLITCFYK